MVKTKKNIPSQEKEGKFFKIVWKGVTHRAQLKNGKFHLWVTIEGKSYYDPQPIPERYMRDLEWEEEKN